MTVPPLFGWEAILTVVALVVVVAVAFFVASAAGRAADSRSEWQAGLEARSSRPEDPGMDRADRSTESGRHRSASEEVHSEP
jgi:hypothetical protein